MHRSGAQLLRAARMQANASLECREAQQVLPALFGKSGYSISTTAGACKENMGEAESETTKGVPGAGGKTPKTPSGAPKTPEKTAEAAGGPVRPGYDPSGKDKGQQPATQKRQDPTQGTTVGESDPKKAGPKYTTATAAWHEGSFSSGGTFNSPALARGPWGHNRNFHAGPVPQAASHDKQNRPDRGSDVGGIQEGSSDINTGSGTGGTNPGLPQNTDPKDAHRTERLDDPEELLQRRRAKDPEAFDKVHGKNASFAEETEGKSGSGGVGTPASEQTKHGANTGLGGREGKQQTMKTNTKQGAAFTTWTRSLYILASNADPKAQQAQKTAGNPYAPTSSAGGTPTDNKADENA